MRSFDRKTALELYVYIFFDPSTYHFSRLFFLPALLSRLGSLLPPVLLTLPSPLPTASNTDT